MKKYQYWMANIEGISQGKVRKIYRMVEQAKELYELPDHMLSFLTELTEEEREAVKRSRKTWNLDKEYEKLLAKEIQIISLEDAEYPGKLRELCDAPYLLYYKGRLPDPDQYAVGIVGARMCSDYGRALALETGKMLGERGISVISGMAKGIDSYSHVGAVNGGGNTFAVLGCGVDVCYPKNNQKLYDRLIVEGGIISEYPPGTQPLSAYFPQRNRLISAFSDSVVVVEAKKRSGSLITADFALEQGRDIYVFPGRIDDALSEGCNRLIKQGAGILLSPEDLLVELRIEGKMIDPESGKKKKTLEKEELLVYSCFDLHSKNFETLQRESGMELTELTEVLFSLGQKGFIEESFKNYYRKKQ